MDYNVLVNVKYKDIVQTNYELKQKDYGQKIIVTAEDYDTNGTTARLFINKSDGTVNERIMLKDNDSYTYILDADDTSSAGKTVFDVKYYKQGVRDSSASFIFNIIPDRFGNLIESKTMSDSLQSALDRVDRTIEIVDEYDEKIEQINKASGRAENAATNSVIAVANCEQATNKANVATDRANTAAATAEGIAENKTGVNDNAVGASTTWSSSKINTSLANQIGTANGASINLPNSFNGGLLLKELQGKSVQNGTPTPDVPVAIQSVGDNGSVVVSVCGKNFVNKSINSLNAFIDINTNTVVLDNSYKIVYLKVKGNTTYTVSKIAGKTFRVATSVNSPSSGSSILSTIANHTGTSLTITTESNANYIIIMYWSSSNGDTTDASALLGSVQLELGTTSTTYEQYKEQLVTIPLTQPLRSVGSVYDRGCVKSNGLWGNERKFATKIFDGSSDEDITLVTGDAATINCSYFQISIVAGSIYTLSNRFPSRNTTLWGVDEEGCVINVALNKFTFKILKSRLTTQDVVGVRAWLALNPLIVQYQLATPVSEPYPQLIQDKLNALQTYQGVTNVFTTDALQSTISVNYGKTDTSALSIYASNMNDNKIDKSKVTNSLAVTEEGFVADPRALKTLNEKIGNLSDLKTTSKTDLVGAVNEVKASVDVVNNNLTSISDELHKAVQKDNIDIDTLTNPGWYNCYGGAHVPDSSIRWNIKVEKETLANLTIIYQKAYYYMGGTGYVSPKTRHTYADSSGNLVYSSWI